MKRILALLIGFAALAWALGPAAADDKDDKGTVVEIDGLKSRTPAAWKPEKPPEKFKKFRVAQFKLPRAEGDKEDAELVITFFGQGGGGGLEANLTRWKGMMSPPEGKDIDDVFKVTKMKVGDVPVTYVDAEGTYKGAPFEKIEPKPGYRMIRVYFGSENGPYFIGLVGPAKTVAENKKGFDEWLKAFK